MLRAHVKYRLKLWWYKLLYLHSLFIFPSIVHGHIIWYYLIERGNIARADARMQAYYDKKMALLDADFILIQGNLKRMMEVRRKK